MFGEDVLISGRQSVESDLRCVVRCIGGKGRIRLIFQTGCTRDCCVVLLSIRIIGGLRCRRERREEEGVLWYNTALSLLQSGGEG